MSKDYQNQGVATALCDELEKDFEEVESLQDLDDFDDDLDEEEDEDFEDDTL